MNRGQRFMEEFFPLKEVSAGSARGRTSETGTSRRCTCSRQGVFALWAVRRGLDKELKEVLRLRLVKAALSADQRHLDFGTLTGKRLGLTPGEVQVYLNGFIYRLRERERQAIERFRSLLHHL